MFTWKAPFFGGWISGAGPGGAPRPAVRRVGKPAAPAEAALVSGPGAIGAPSVPGELALLDRDQVLALAQGGGLVAGDDGAVVADLHLLAALDGVLQGLHLVGHRVAGELAPLTETRFSPWPREEASLPVTMVPSSRSSSLAALDGVAQGLHLAGHRVAGKNSRAGSQGCGWTGSTDS